MKNTDPLSDSVYAKYSANVKQRVSIVEGNYMDVTHLRQTVNADVFFFKWIFHNNNDENCGKILAGLYQVMKPTSKVIICDCVLEHSPNEWKFPLMLDLAMAEAVNGKERTKDEWITRSAKATAISTTYLLPIVQLASMLWTIGMNVITLTKVATS